jgi:NAD(P)-dependent dehydrogenase (short-subunit alcohol dehydrogenase family)
MAERPVVVVTGAAGHIGGALLTAFHDAGHTTVGLDLGRRTADSPAADHWVTADITDRTAMEIAMSEVRERFGRIDVLVNNAGVTALGTFADTAPEVFERVMAVNLTGAVVATQAALDDLTRAQGWVVVISSVAGFAPVIGRPAYSASKHAVTGLFESIRGELADRGIRILLVHPTFLATAPGTVGPAGQRTTTGRLLTAVDVADAVIRGLRRKRDRVLPGRTAWLAYHVHRLWPGAYRWAMARQLRTKG